MKHSRIVWNLWLLFGSHLFGVFTFNGLVESNRLLDISLRVIDVNVPAVYYVFLTIPVVWILLLTLAKWLLEFPKLSWKFIYYTSIPILLITWVNPISLSLIMHFGIYNIISIVIVILCWYVGFLYHQQAEKNENVIKRGHRNLLGYLLYTFAFAMLFASLFQGNTYRLLILDVAYIIFVYLIAFFYLEFLEKKYLKEDVWGAQNEE